MTHQKWSNCCINKCGDSSSKMFAFILFITYYWRKKEFEDTKGVIRIHKSKDRQHNGQKKKDKKRSTKHTHKTKNWVTRTTIKTEGELRFSGRSCFNTTDIFLQFLSVNICNCETLSFWLNWRKLIKLWTMGVGFPL